jgi:hypothetical protein
MHNLWAVVGTRSLRSLARASQLSESQLSRLFRGQRGGTLETLLALVDAGLPCEPLLRGLVEARREYLGQRAAARVVDRYATALRR